MPATEEELRQHIERARQDPRPPVPHEVVREQLLQDVQRLRKKVEQMGRDADGKG